MAGSLRCTAPRSAGACAERRRSVCAPRWLLSAHEESRLGPEARAAAAPAAERPRLRVDYPRTWQQATGTVEERAEQLHGVGAGEPSRAREDVEVVRTRREAQRSDPIVVEDPLGSNRRCNLPSKRRIPRQPSPSEPGPPIRPCPRSDAGGRPRRRRRGSRPHIRTTFAEPGGRCSTRFAEGPRRCAGTVGHAPERNDRTELQRGS
jgi:hypothetical protein